MNTQTLNRRTMLKLCGYVSAGTVALNAVSPLFSSAQDDEAAALLGGFTWIRQSGFRIQNGDQVIYLDPIQVPDSPHDADVVLITHPHGDHCDTSSVQKVSKDSTQILAEPDSVNRLGSGFSKLSPIKLGENMEVDNLQIATVRAYNNTKSFHPRSNDWLGFVITLEDGRTIYHGGDTDFVTEMNDIDADVALLPVGGNFTMRAVEAAQAVKAIQPKLAIPMHWGGSVGSVRDAQTFQQELEGDVAALVLEFGQSFPVVETAVKDWNKS